MVQQYSKSVLTIFGKKVVTGGDCRRYIHHFHHFLLKEILNEQAATQGQTKTEPHLTKKIFIAFPRHQKPKLIRAKFNRL